MAFGWPFANKKIQDLCFCFLLKKKSLLHPNKKLLLSFFFQKIKNYLTKHFFKPSASLSKVTFNNSLLKLHIWVECETCKQIIVGPSVCVAFYERSFLKIEGILDFVFVVCVFNGQSHDRN